jgi:hypothetical protein
MPITPRCGGARTVSERADALKQLTDGDIFHAESPNGARFICLATSVTATTVYARNVTIQKNYEFDRQTGVASSGPERIPCIIESIKPLPQEVHQIFLELDQRYRLCPDPEIQTA